MTNVNSWLRMEPQAERPPVRVSRDWLLVAAVAGTTVAEVVARDSMVWRSVALLVGFALALTMLWRRTRPLAMVAFGFGALVVVDVDALILGAEPFFLFAAGFVVVLVYSLFRWGTGSQAAIGSLIVLSEWSLATASDFTGVTDAIGGIVVLLFAAAIGVAVRYQRMVRTQQFEQVRSNEREMLARELHDTVAHHVSAIAIQAQAGQVLAKSGDPAGATQALRAVEEQASRTLAEMRAIVGTLRRDDGTPQISTQRDIADIESLATAEGSPGLRVMVECCGDVNDLRPSVQAALHRLAQESVTNTLRHGRHATSVQVRVTADAKTVRLTVTDDGDRGSSNLRPPGYGLVGMTERVKLLGGTLQAGPGPAHGWTVEAVIPREGNRP